MNDTTRKPRKGKKAQASDAAKTHSGVYPEKEYSEVHRAPKRVGLELKEARSEKNLTQAQVAESLNIRKSYIEAIEGSRFTDLPGPAYAIGFVRSFADYLDLDSEAIVERFRGEIAGIEPVSKLDFPMPIKDRRFPGGAVIAGVLCIGLLAYGGWYMMQRAEKAGGEGGASSQGRSVAKASPASAAGIGPKRTALNTGAAPDAVRRTAASAGLKLETKPGPGSESAVRSSLPDAEPEKRPALVVPPPPPRQRRTVAAETPQQAALPRKPAAPAAVPARTEKPQSGRARIVLRASRDTWIKLQRPDGSTVVARMLKAGEIYPILSKRGLLLTAGNGGGLSIVVDGRQVRGLGGAGAGRNQVRLDADALLASR